MCVVRFKKKKSGLGNPGAIPLSSELCWFSKAWASLHASIRCGPHSHSAVIKALTLQPRQIIHKSSNPSPLSFGALDKDIWISTPFILSSSLRFNFFCLLVRGICPFDRGLCLLPSEPSSECPGMPPCPRNTSAHVPSNLVEPLRDTVVRDAA